MCVCTRVCIYIYEDTTLLLHVYMHGYIYEIVHVSQCEGYMYNIPWTYCSVPGKHPWALNHNPSFFTILGACPVYGVLTVCTCK